MSEIGLNSDFESGNGELQAVHEDGRIDVTMSSDADAPWHQWFYFELTGAAGREVTVRLTNAGQAAFAKGYEGYNALAREGDGPWRRVESRYDGKVLEIPKSITSDRCAFAYFVPFNGDDHQAMIARASAAPWIDHDVLGKTVDGRDMDRLQMGSDTGINIWIISRQHPGEAMAEWWVDGLLNRVLAEVDKGGAVDQVLAQTRLHIIPCMNPDGVARGHIRGNARGVDLNRAWAEPDPEKSPEVFLVRAAMGKSGVDFMLDVHGDEAFPYVFMVGTTGLPSQSERQTHLKERFRQEYLKASPDFQIEHGYPAPGAGKANLKICANNMAENHGCLGLTLEQPFKDNANAPDPEEGWSPKRSQALGAAYLDALAAILPDLKAD